MTKFKSRYKKKKKMVNVSSSILPLFYVKFYQKTLQAYHHAGRPKYETRPKKNYRRLSNI